MVQIYTRPNGDITVVPPEQWEEAEKKVERFIRSRLSINQRADLAYEEWKKENFKEEDL